jgi:hypothetical protein
MRIVIGVVAGLLVTSATAPHRLVINFDGGYAFVLSDGNKSLNVGPIEKPHFYSLDYKLHPLKLSVSKGLIDPKTTVPTETIGHDNSALVGWDLTDRIVEVTVDGDVLENEPIKLPEYKAANECTSQEQEVNNRYFFADITRIAGDKVLHDDWRTRLAGRVILGGGELSITALARGCFEFSKNGGTRRLANGLVGTQYTHDFTGKNITLNIKKNNKDETSLGSIIIVPQDGVVQFSFQTHHGMQSAVGKAIKHFKHYYWLFKADIHDDKRQIPTWLDSREGNVTPGEACPPALYEAQ